MEKLLKKYDNDFETITSIIKKEEHDPIVGDKQPEEAYLLNLHAKIKAIKRILN